MATLTNMKFHGRDTGCSLLILFHIIVVPALIITLRAEVCNAVDDTLYCSNNTYSIGSDFERNLNTVFNSLVQHTHQTGFNTSVYGQSPNRVYGLLQCRGDATPDQCYNCSRNATTIINYSQNCGNAVGGRIWLDFCFLRYQTDNFIGQLDTLGYCLYQYYDLSSPDKFNVARDKLLSNLSSEVAYGSSRNRYASGVTAESFPTIYALAQCTRDILDDDCIKCLTRGTNDIKAYYNGASGVQYFMGSCILSYEIHLFLNLPSLAEAPVAETPTTTAPVAETPTTTAPVAETPFTTAPVAETPTTTAPVPVPVAETPSTTAPVPAQVAETPTTAAPVPAQVAETPTTAAPVPAQVAETPTTIASVPAPVLDTPTTHSKIPIILGVVGGGLLLALLAVLVWMFTTRRGSKRYEVHQQVQEDILINEDRQILTFKMEELVAATENFNDDNKLGQGGFGSVYKGTTHDGKEIAVKKLSINSTQGMKEFLTEVKLIAKIQHRNLVKLLGCCAEASEKMLVYEYRPNSSLDKILFDPLKRKEFDWQKRYNIILGVARGLLYLHEDSQPRIIHRDIKAGNILLDEKLNPKIADFGLAKLFSEDESYVSMLTKVAGTHGYLAPEYAMYGQLSAKADVYSFGVLLMELVAGRKNMDYNLSPEMQILLRWAWRSYEEGNIVDIIDPLARIESCDEEQALRCIQIGLLCTQPDSSVRPPMSTVTLMLSSHSVTLPDLTKPVFPNSGSGLSHASATTSSASSYLAPAPPSNASVSSIELVPR